MTPLVPAALSTAILSALPEEQHGLIELLDQPQQVRHAGRVFWQGLLFGQPVVLALSRVGKVAAATTATALIERFSVGRMLFTGVAGGLAPGVQVGDIVVANGFVQHDLDASPLFPRYEVPLYGQSVFEADAALTALLLQASRQALAAGMADNNAMSFPHAQVHHGLLASGDQFICAGTQSQSLQAGLTSGGYEALAVEMECAAVAQVCHDYQIGLAAMRTISDRADDTAHVDFPAFIAGTASVYARTVVEKFLGLL